MAEGTGERRSPACATGACENFVMSQSAPMQADATAGPGRLGLFGGSFDPVTLGHVLVAQAAREELVLDKIFFIPAAQSPFKADRQPASASQRLMMLRLALAGMPFCEVDDQEIRRGGLSYTVDTVRGYARKFPGAKLFWLIGGDHVAQLAQWREAEALAKLADFAVMPRPGEKTGAFPAPFRGQVLKGFPLGVSSSEIRDRVRRQLPVEHLVPPGVAEAIRNNRLYL